MMLTNDLRCPRPLLWSPDRLRGDRMRHRKLTRLTPHGDHHQELPAHAPTRDCENAVIVSQSRSLIEIFAAMSDVRCNRGKRPRWPPVSVLTWRAVVLAAGRWPPAPSVQAICTIPGGLSGHHGLYCATVKRNRAAIVPGRRPSDPGCRPCTRCRAGMPQ